MEPLPNNVYSPLQVESSIRIKMDGCVCACARVCVCLGITLERLERFQPNLVHTLLYVCVSQVKVKVKVTLRLTVSQSVCLGVGHAFGAHDQILLFSFLLSENCFALCLGAPSLTRGRNLMYVLYIFRREDGVGGREFG
jgi:hypothetical protein